MPDFPFRLSDTLMDPAGCGMTALIQVSGPRQGSMRTVLNPGEAGSIPLTVESSS
jgi:hypothetical protein